MFTFCSPVVYCIWIIVLPDIHSPNIFAGERHGFPINLPARHVPHTIVITDNRSSAGSCYQRLTQCFIWCNLFPHKLFTIVYLLTWKTAQLWLSNWLVKKIRDSYIPRNNKLCLLQHLYTGRYFNTRL